MITILSIESDQSTNQVIDWLAYYNAAWKRINAEDFEEKSLIIDSRNGNDRNSPPEVVWFRKWKKATDYITCFTKNAFIEINKAKEFEEYSKYIFNGLASAFWLNSPENWSADKLTQLTKAQKVGLKTPPTILTSSRKELKVFLQKHQQIITKNLAANLLVLEDNEAYMSYTSTIDEAEIELLSNDFYPSLFQKQIEKEYEVRSYYLDGEIYSMAIFSQNDSQTKVDFRQYNLQKPNRNIPYKLPSKIEEQIRCLMSSLKINSGSLDFIKEKNGDLFFLEVNPLGQFGMTSYPCNYFLEKKIANYLIKKEYEHKKVN